MTDDTYDAWRRTHGPQGFARLSDERKTIVTEISDIDVFDSMRALIADGINLDDRAAVEAAIIVPDDYRRDAATFRRFVDWCIKAARANIEAGGLQRTGLGVAGFVPREDED